eukprot:m.49393 g.49393  ORF g.49393 m.49393 type:complete len:625 (-) comp15323_c0_seq2:768-2642(-)
MATAIGIDLGMTYSCVSVFEHGKAKVISNAGERTTRSCVAFSGSTRLIGVDAITHPATATNTIFNAKRVIGRQYTDSVVRSDSKKWPFEIVDDGNGKAKIEATYFGSRRRFFPEEISAIILGKMKAIAESYLGSAVREAVVTVPAHFNDAQRQATKDAGIIAGLKVVRIINEPTAAALAYGLHSFTKSARHVVVFDLGGGSLDVSILKIHAGDFEVKSTAGNPQVGGESFDEMLVNFLAAGFDRQHNTSIRQCPRAMWQLRIASEHAKCELSHCEETVVTTKSLFDGKNLQVTIRRDQFEELCKPLFDALLLPVRRALLDAQLDASCIDEIVLVGGSTRIPRVRQIVSAYFNGKPFSAGVHPDEAVACGAAVQAAILTGQDLTGTLDGVLLRDVTPLSLGLETACGVMTVLIPRGTLIPTAKIETFSTHHDNQTDVLIQVYEGEHSMATDNHRLGEFQLSGVRPAKCGIPQIEVTYSVDVDGILEVSAVERSTGKSEKILIHRKTNRLSQAEIDEFVLEAEKFQAEDRRRRSTQAARRKLETYAYQMKQVAEDDKLSKQLTPNDRGKLHEQVVRVIAWLVGHTVAQQEDFEHQLCHLEKVCNPIIQKMYCLDGSNVDSTVQDVD